MTKLTFEKHQKNNEQKKTKKLELTQEQWNSKEIRIELH